MSEQEVIPQPQAFAAMTTDMQVSLDDVVSAFVSEYENNLFTRKKELGRDIRALEKDLADIDKKVEREVTGAEFKQRLPFGLACKVDEGSIHWGERSNHVVFQITIEEKDSSRYSNRINLNKTKNIPAALVKAHNKVMKELNEIRAELNEVLVNLKSVNRKERQVRGKIAVRKLKDSGYADLMKDPELIQLVQLED